MAGMTARPGKANHLNWRLWSLVAAGGALGAGSREGLSLLIPPVNGVPVVIALINIAGAFLLGFLYESVTRPGFSAGRASRLKLLLGTGFCGGFTTYSSLATDTATLALHGRAGVALLYVAVTVVVGAAATWVGIVVGSRTTKAGLVELS